MRKRIFYAWAVSMVNIASANAYAIIVQTSILEKMMG
jgi:hypothetical protein